MDLVLLFAFHELDSILISSCGFVLATWQLRKSANTHILGLCEGFPPPFVKLSLSMKQKSTLKKREGVNQPFFGSWSVGF